MIRLVVSDVDGTLVKDGTCDISPEYYEVIRGLIGLGIKVAIASGRQEDSIREVIPFPMNKQAMDIMMGAPAEVESRQLEEVHIRIQEP